MTRDTRKLKAYQKARRRVWLAQILTEIAALEGRLGLMTEQAKADFYGVEYLDPEERLGRLIEQAAAVGV